MKKYRIISVWLALTILCLNSTAAQVHGYLGKRTLIGYNLNISPFVSLGGGGLDGSQTFGLRHDLHLDHIIAPKSMIGLEVGYLPTKLTYDSFSYNANISATFVGFTYTTYGQFRGSVLAPVGDYLQFKFFVAMLGLDDPRGRTLGPQGGSPQTRNMTYAGVGLGYGHTQVFRDQFVFDIGANLNIIPRVTVGNANDNLPGADLPLIRMRSAIGGLSFLTVRVGVSGLFF